MCALPSLIGGLFSVLSYISKRLWVNLEEERSGAVKITFDDFLRPVVAA